MLDFLLAFTVLTNHKNAIERMAKVGIPIQQIALAVSDNLSANTALNISVKQDDAQADATE